MRLGLTLAFAAVTLPLFADEDVFEGLKRGDRVLITMVEGGSFKGVVKSLVGDNLRIDVTGDSSAASGSVVFERRDVRKVVVLGTLTPEEMDRTGETGKEEGEETGTKPENGGEGEKPKEEEPTEEEKAAALLAKFPSPDWSAKRKAEIEAKAEFERSEEEREFLVRYGDWANAMEGLAKLARLELLKKFPPKDGWGEPRYRKLKDRFIVMGIPLAEDEQEFVDRFEDWKKGLAEYEAL
ncbi:MAG: hypothetical protein HYY18_09460, partial [Planctomycetes bacterium]|nr:hypothetical protein [Planctomycetota bacterium]